VSRAGAISVGSGTLDTERSLSVPVPFVTQSNLCLLLALVMVELRFCSLSHGAGAISVGSGTLDTERSLSVPAPFVGNSGFVLFACATGRSDLSLSVPVPRHSPHQGVNHEV